MHKTSYENTCPIDGMYITRSATVKPTLKNKPAAGKNGTKRVQRALRQSACLRARLRAAAAIEMRASVTKAPFRISGGDSIRGNTVT